MKRTYYLFNDGRVSRKDNTLCFVARDKDENEQAPKYIPIETIDTMYVFGALDVNAALLNYLGQDISVCTFLIIMSIILDHLWRRIISCRQNANRTNQGVHQKRSQDAHCYELIDGATYNMLKNMKYYDNRGKDTSEKIIAIRDIARKHLRCYRYSHA
jgi:CRISPR-associated protein Cas1